MALNCSIGSHIWAPNSNPLITPTCSLELTISEVTLESAMAYAEDRIHDASTAIDAQLLEERMRVDRTLQLV
jgi:hypothetical protein